MDDAMLESRFLRAMTEVANKVLQAERGHMNMAT
jgi:hypothetical protein